jgi:hypothetical protein
MHNRTIDGKSGERWEATFLDCLFVGKWTMTPAVSVVPRYHRKPEMVCGIVGPSSPHRANVSVTAEAVAMPRGRLDIGSQGQPVSSEKRDAGWPSLVSLL